MNRLMSVKRMEDDMKYELFLFVTLIRMLISDSDFNTNPEVIADPSFNTGPAC